MKRVKKVHLAMAASVMVAMLFSVPASAASSVTGNVGGVNVHGSTSISARSATGTTICYSGGDLYVHTTFNYGYGDKTKSVSAVASNVTTQISATAVAHEDKPGNIVAKGAYSTHSVTYNGAYWSASTNV